MNIISPVKVRAILGLKQLIIDMRKIKRDNIDSSRLITKAELARRQKVSQTEIDRQINSGRWTIVLTQDEKELVYL